MTTMSTQSTTITSPNKDCDLCGSARPAHDFSLRWYSKDMGANLLECRQCLLSGTDSSDGAASSTCTRTCRKCNTPKPLASYHCEASGRTNWWRICQDCRTEDSHKRRSRELRAVTHGFLCPIFSSYIRAASPWKNLDTPEDIVSLREDKPNRFELVGEYEIVFYVGSRVDIGPKCYSRRTEGTVSLSIDENSGALVGAVRLGKHWISTDTDTKKSEENKIVPSLVDDMDISNVDGDSIDGDSILDDLGVLDVSDMSSSSTSPTTCASPTEDHLKLDTSTMSYNYYSPQTGRIDFSESTTQDVRKYAARFEEDEREETRRLRVSPTTNAVAVKMADADLVSAVIQTVDTRAAVPRCRDDRYWRAMWHKVPDVITVEQGEKLMDAHRDMNNSWICTKLHLPELAAFNVRSFLTPEPAFFFEPGYLWLRFTSFEKARGSRHPALVVARRKKPSDTVLSE